MEGLGSLEGLPEEVRKADEYGRSLDICLIFIFLLFLVARLRFAVMVTVASVVESDNRLHPFILLTIL